jgi:hypothetical protein
VPTFPEISPGVITQLPFTKARAFRNTKVSMPCGIQYAYRHRTDPLRSWSMHYTCITELEAETLRAFFADCEGRLHTFDFTDPDDLYAYTCRFDQDEISIQYLGPNHCALELSIVEVP